MPEKVQEEKVREKAQENGEVKVQDPATTNASSTSSSDVSFARQPQVTFTIEFIIPQNIEQGVLDTWLSLLEQEVPSVLWQDTKNLTRDNDDIKYWITSCLELSQSILWALRIPAFDPFTVLDCKPNVSKQRAWHARVRLPCPDASFKSITIKTINRALSLAVWAAENPPDAVTRNRFFKTIQDDVLTPNRGNTAFGRSTLEILKVAHAEQIPILSLGRGIYQLGWGAQSKIIDRSSTPGDSALAPRITGDKSATTRVLAMAGLPFPINRSVKNSEDALKHAQQLGWPVVIKPADGERGEGVTVDVSEEELHGAFEKALNASKNQTVLVEQQVEGVCHRIFIAGGDLLYAVKRLPIGVYGDSQRTVADLVSDAYKKEQNRPPWMRTPIKTIDSEARTVLWSMDIDELSIPEEGYFVPLRRIETTASGGVDVDVTADVHPENIQIAVEAAHLMGLEVAGVDLITTDISRPWYESNAVVNEVNYAPLLGGGTISRQHISAYLERLLRGNGRIPVEVFIGGEAALSAAQSRGTELAKKCSGVTITSATHTQLANGRVIPMPLSGLGFRTQALIMRQYVDALVLVVQDDEVLERGLPLDFYDEIVHVDDQVRSRNTDQHNVSADRLHAIVTILERRKNKDKK